VVSDVTTDLMLDVDVSRSFRPIPASAQAGRGRFVLPVPPVAPRRQPPRRAGTVAGTVWFDAGSPADPLDDVPITGATVTAVQGGADVTATATDAAGAYAIPACPPATTRCAAEATGFVTAESPATIVAGNATNVVFRLSPAP